MKNKYIKKLLLMREGTIEGLLIVNPNNVQNDLEKYFKYSFTPNESDIKRTNIDIYEDFSTEINYDQWESAWEITIFGQDGTIFFQAFDLTRMKQTKIN